MVPPPLKKIIIKDTKSQLDATLTYEMVLIVHLVSRKGK